MIEIIENFLYSKEFSVFASVCSVFGLILTVFVSKKIYQITKINIDGSEKNIVGDNKQVIKGNNNNNNNLKIGD